MKLWIGCSGWFYPHWAGLFYPDDIPKKRWFEYYASRFATVELNLPFYRFPTPAMARVWYERAPAGFRYTLKVNRIITHLKRFHGTQRLVRDFYALGDVLADKMGCFLFQLPPMTRYAPDTLARISDQLNPRFANVIEFRHESWWTPEVADALRTAGAIFCVVSGPHMPADFAKTSDEAYVRFHGFAEWYGDRYPPAQLRRWARKIREARPRTVWAYFNNDAHAAAPRDALALRRLLAAPALRKAE